MTINGSLKSQQSSRETFTKMKYALAIEDSKIKNSSGKKIDVLINTIDNFLSSKTPQHISFKTDCMVCAGIIPHNQGLVYSNQLLILKDELWYYSDRILSLDESSPLKIQENERLRTKQTFSFSEGKGTIDYINVSCNDANYYRLKLNYPTGQIIIDSLLNAEFFEYDLDENGTKEQFIVASRNCSQELAILRIRD